MRGRGGTGGVAPAVVRHWVRRHDVDTHSGLGRRPDGNRPSPERRTNQMKKLNRILMIIGGLAAAWFCASIMI